jgi:type IV pilus assembly protein PilQ
VYFTINYARPADIAAKINDIKSEKGKISVDEPTSLVIYSDYPYFIDTARQLISRLDKPKPQVMIEARIIMLGASSTRDLGIDWGFNTSRPSNPTEKYNFQQAFQVNVPPIPSTYGLNWAQMIGKTMLDINLTLSALETLGKSKTLSAPRVLTLDGIEAVISQGVDVPYLTLSDAGTASTSFRKAVLELKVKPHITPDGRVKLGILAKNEKPDFSRVVNGQPPIATQEINTELFVDDGNTVVIGGIIVENEDTSTGGTPGLMKVPILGQMFRTDTTRREKTELLIFITPRIIGVTTPETGNRTSLQFSIPFAKLSATMGPFKCRGLDQCVEQWANYGRKREGYDS